MNEHSELADRDLQPGHEQTTANVRQIGWWTAGLGAMILASLALMWGLWQWLRSTEQVVEAWPAQADQGPVPGIVLDPEQIASRRIYERQQAELLSGYGWVDKEQKIGRIPIERAMQIIVERNDEQQ